VTGTALDGDSAHDVIALRRVLGLKDLVLLTIGTVLGSGIFLVPAVVLRETGARVDVALLLWAAGGVIALAGALTFAELGTVRPAPGGVYVYLRDAFGPLPGFLYGWTSFFAIASGSIAALATAFSTYLAPLLSLDPLAARVAAVLFIAATALLNVRGTRRSASVQNWMTLAKLVAIVVMSLALALTGRHGHTGVSADAVTSLTFRGLGAGMIGVLWAYEGWQYATFAAGEARDPRHTLPRALPVATTVLIAVYLLANLGYVAALGPRAAAHSSYLASDAVATIVGSAAGTLMSVLILVSIFSAANGLMLTAPRMYFAMARDGLFFKSLGNLHGRFQTPSLAVVALAVWAMLLTATGTFEKLLTYVVFTSRVFYALTALSIFFYRQELSNAPRGFRVPGYPVTPLLFIVATILIIVNTLVTQPVRGLVGVGVVLLGTPAFFLWRARARRAAVVPA
jgi:APA family basic amino acid/polyamine antiporter